MHIQHTWKVCSNSKVYGCRSPYCKLQSERSCKTYWCYTNGKWFCRRQGRDREEEKIILEVLRIWPILYWERRKFLVIFRGDILHELSLMDIRSLRRFTRKSKWLQYYAKWISIKICNNTNLSCDILNYFFLLGAHSFNFHKTCLFFFLSLIYFFCSS